MIKLRGGFIRTKEGNWINIKKIINIKVVEVENAYSIFSLDVKNNLNCIDGGYENYDYAQEVLDGLMNLLEYEKSGQ